MLPTVYTEDKQLPTPSYPLVVKLKKLLYISNFFFFRTLRRNTKYKYLQEAIDQTKKRLRLFEKKSKD